MFTRLKEGMIAAARGPHALRALAGYAALESVVLPVPPDLMLIPMVMADRRRAFVIAGVCTIASVVGGLVGYGVGYFAWQIAGLPLLTFFLGPSGVVERFAALEAQVEGIGFWPQLAGIFGAGLTGFPYKVITVASGALNVSLPAFAIGSLAARGIRFFAEAGLIFLLGRRAALVIERRFGLITTGFFGLVVAGVLALRYLA